jgi:bifunctional non-homologous end joining protein LigD
MHLAMLLDKADISSLPFSESFDDPVALLEAANRMGLEGIVSKQTAQPYKSGRNRGWIKVKCHAWRAAHADRGELFKK